jgi:hypothetical protein
LAGQLAVLDSVLLAADELAFPTPGKEKGSSSDRDKDLAEPLDLST